MARTETMVQLTQDLLAELDAESTRRGISRSALIRLALDTYFSQLRADDVGRRIVAGYAAIPPEAPDAWAPIGGLGDRSTIELAQRLDEEERRTGQSPW